MPTPATTAPKCPTQLDHVIFLLPYEDIISPPKWVTNNFTVSPGGQHADGKTENRLILFADGTYVELIAFINDDPEKRKGHWWDKLYGIIDFALMTHTPFNYAALQERLKASGSGVLYAKPVEGGRRTPDGQELKWKVTFPLDAERGEVPFWCHDVTPRERRVPVNEKNTDHPCGAIGMAGVIIEALPDRLKRFEPAYTAITEEEAAPGSRRYPVGNPIHSKDQRAGSWISLQQIDQEKATHSLRLMLRLHCEKDGQAGIREDVRDGTVVIGFE